MGLTALGASLLRRCFWAGTWGAGVAIGVAAGGRLTVIGGEASVPGVEPLQLTRDVVVLPALAGGSVFAVHLVGQLSIALTRRARSG